MFLYFVNSGTITREQATRAGTTKVTITGETTKAGAITALVSQTKDTGAVRVPITTTVARSKASLTLGLSKYIGSLEVLLQEWNFLGFSAGYCAS